MEQERRQYKRFPFSNMVAYDSKHERYIEARGYDVSLGGMSFETHEYVEDGLVLWLSFCVPTKNRECRQIDVESRIVNVIDTPHGCRFGVSFQRMMPDDTVFFEDFIRNLEAGSPKDA